MEDYPGRLIFFDLETGGIDPMRHPIIQIAAIAVDGDLQPIEAIEAKVQFEVRTANRNSLRKNHYHPGEWAKVAIPPKLVARQVAEFLRRHASVSCLGTNGKSYQVARLAAHNAAFDGPFLQGWYEKLGVYLPAHRQILCTLQRAMWLVAEDRSARSPPRDFKLATLCQHFDVPFHAASAHEALADVTATVGLYRAMVTGRNKSDARSMAAA